MASPAILLKILQGWHDFGACTNALLHSPLCWAEVWLRGRTLILVGDWNCLTLSNNPWWVIGGMALTAVQGEPWVLRFAENITMI